MEHKPGAYFDLYKELTRNPAFRDKVQKAVNRICELEAEHAPSEELQEAGLKLLDLCDNNISMLVPYYFPNFAYGEPLSMDSRPYAYSLMADIAGGTVTICAGRQIGKCVSGDSAVILCKDGGQPFVSSIESVFENAKGNSVSHTGRGRVH